MKDKLKIVFAKSYDPSYESALHGCDVILFDRKAFPTVKIKRELSGQEENLIKMRALSKKFTAPMLVALKTESFGGFHRSIAVFEKGKLLSLSDANLPDGGDKGSVGYKVTKTSVGKIGVAVSKDIKNPDCIKALTACESQIIVNLYVDLSDFKMPELIQSLSYLYGVPIISCGTHGVVASSSGGKLNFAAKLDFAEFFLDTKRTVKEKTYKTFSNI